VHPEQPHRAEFPGQPARVVDLPTLEPVGHERVDPSRAQFPDGVADRALLLD
jgi:hypothetical protein